MKNSQTKDFVAYEYLSVNVKSNKEQLYIDCYENFGWQFINSNGLIDKEDYYINCNVNNLVHLKFKRDRKINNKSKIITLQKKCENSLKELDKLEKQPNYKGSTYAVINSVIGTLFVTISVICIVNNINFIGLLLGIIGFILWFLSYPIYKKIREKQEKINTPLIEEKYDIIYDLCEQSRKLLN